MNKSFKDSNLFQELIKEKNVKFLTAEESKAILENTEFHGCIGIPKNHNQQLPQEEAQ